MNEALGLKDYELMAYFAVFRLTGTPPDEMNQLNAAINAADGGKDPQDKFRAIGFAINPARARSWPPAIRPSTEAAHTGGCVRTLAGARFPAQRRSYRGPGGGGGRPNSTYRMLAVQPTVPQVPVLLPGGRGLSSTSYTSTLKRSAPAISRGAM